MSGFLSAATGNRCDVLKRRKIVWLGHQFDIEYISYRLPMEDIENQRFAPTSHHKNIDLTSDQIKYQSCVSKVNHTDRIRVKFVWFKPEVNSISVKS